MKMIPMWRGGWVLVIAALLLAACGRGADEAAPTMPQVSVVTVMPRQVKLEDELPGRVAAIRVAEIRPQVGGIIQRRLFAEGTEIRMGQPLFQINPAPFKAEADSAAAALQRAEAVLVHARVQTTRLQPLAKVEAVSRQTYDDAVSQRDQAAAEVAQARAALARRQPDLQFATVKAPISGRIDQAMVSEGALVGVGDANPMARIQQIDQVYVDVRQPASALDALRAALAPRAPDGSNASAETSLPAHILLSNGEPYPHAGRILFSGINVDAGTGDVLVRIVVDNPDRALLPGMFVRARVPRGQPGDALLVPQQAVTRTGGMSGVWIVGAKNLARRVSVELGDLVEGDYVVRGGLRAGQRVVVEGGDRLTDGTEIAPKAWQPASANASLR